MDVLLRLRVLIWVLVISLWGVMVYQYLGEDEKETTAMRQVVNPYPAIPDQSPMPLPAVPGPDPNQTVALAPVLAPAVPPALVVPGTVVDPANMIVAPTGDV